MAEDNNFMNLDLNLGPVDNLSNDDGEHMRGSYPHIMRVEDLLDTATAQLSRVSQLRSHRWRPLWRHLPVSPERQNLSLELISINDLQIGEGSVAPYGNAAETDKLCENCTSYAEGKDLGTKKECEKNNGDEGSFFDCNICLDLAMDPVVTCCGHLFCWSCIYRWLYLHSDVKRCPICKGGVTMKDVTPIYGRGNDKREPKLEFGFKIPPRPQACSIQGRRHISRSTFPMDEVIRHLEDTYDMNNQINEIHARSSDVIWDQQTYPYPRVSIFRGLHREHPPALPVDDLNDTGSMYRGVESVDFATPNVALNSVGSTNHRPREVRRPRSLGIRRAHAHRSALPSFPPDSYSNLERNQEPDRDSVSSRAAAIHSESLTVDNAVEIESNLARSTLSSTRRGDASRISDVDSGDSPPSRRRRLTY